MSTVPLRFVLLLTILLNGCVQTLTVQRLESDALLTGDLLGFIADGRTTRTEVLLQLGEPSASFESERILTYRLQALADGGLVVRTPSRDPVQPALAYWDQHMFSLVQVFDQDGRLVRYSLVGTR